jgi:hypothetical protein
MAFEAPLPIEARPSLPSLSDYLRAVLAVGMASLRLALPALAFLYFYRLGMDLYLAFSSDSYSPLSGLDQETIMTSIMLRAAAYLPLLVLVYTPFLPLQDGILTGRRRTFRDSVRLVLERLFPFAISAIAQGIVLIGPPLLLFGGMALLIRTFPSRPGELVKALAVATLIPCFFYVLVIGLFLLFATPAVVLDRRGPLASIRKSFSLVAAHFGGILGRLLVFLFLLLFAAMAVSIPVAFLQAAAIAAHADHPAFKIAGSIWSAAVSAALFPFTVASLMVLYRAVSPSVAAEPLAETAPGPAPQEEPHRATSPFQFE